ncbi:MAG: acetylxylan esterase [Acidobacteria bacterium]|nr:acetylxylan esterase [Acidobacteriota bacterium]
MRPISLFLILAAAGAAQDDRALQFLTNHTDYGAIRNQLAEYEHKRAFALLDTREALVAKWTAADAKARRTVLREKMIRALGGFPERTPLNARVVGVIEQPDYKIEKILFESQPRFFVTANLYLPTKGTGPFPAILFPLGHEEGAKAHGTWQQLLVTFARKGYVCLAWDTLGQGERVQLYDEDFESSKVVRSTTEHTILGTQTLLSGESLARYTVWDGIRALDYLVSRPEVDPKRIGCTGNSGGGTHTAYLSALDDRIQVAAPSCYITSWRRLLQTIGPQDAEQCIPPWIGGGLDHADFIHAFAPKPFMILSAVRDFFSIAGARESFAEAKRIYDLHGAPQKIAMSEADDGHGYSKPRRLAAYRWFDRWLKGVDEETVEEPVNPRLEEDLRSTKTGQVQTSLGGESVFSLNRARARGFQRSMPSSDLVKRLIGYERETGTPPLKPFGALLRDGYRIEKLTYQSEPGIEIPALLFVPAGHASKRAAIVYVHGRGKAYEVTEVETLVRQGLIVLSIDARGFGETRKASDDNGSDWPRYFGDYNSAMTAFLTGSTLIGGRARDISRAVDLLSARAEVDPQRVYGAAREGAGVALLHAAALDPRLRRVAIEQTLESYQSVVEQRLHRGVFEHVVPGVLRHYDLPDLARMLAPRPLVIVDSADPMGLPAPLDRVKAAYPSAKVMRRQSGDTSATLYGFGAP